MKAIAPIIEFDQGAAKREISAAWHAYQQAYQETEHRGLDFGRVCCDWRDKFGAQGRKGQGLAQILRKLDPRCKEGKAYYWMDEYEQSIGVEQEKNEKDEKVLDEEDRYRELRSFVGKLYDGLSLDQKAKEIHKHADKLKEDY
jgi:hypothetical protein